MSTSCLSFALSFNKLARKFSHLSLHFILPSFYYSNLSSQINLIIKIILSFFGSIRTPGKRRGNEADCKKLLFAHFFLPLFLCVYGISNIVWISELPETTQIKFYVSLQLNIQLQTVIPLVVVEIINFRFLCCK